MQNIPSSPLVSVIIPTYNRFSSLVDAINSVLEQTIANQVEVVVVNDASTDPDYAKLSVLFPNVVIVNLSVNSRVLTGTTSAHGLTKDKGLDVARGEWVAFLDDDDVFIDREKLAYQIEVMTRYGCLMSSSNMLRGHGPRRYNPNTSLYFWSFDHGEYLGNYLYKLTLSNIKDTNLINNSTCILHSSIVKQTGRFSVCQYEDWDYWKRAMVYTDCIYINRPTVYYCTGNVKEYQ